MADVTHTIHVRVLAFDPAEGRDIPVPGATVLCEDRGWLWNPNLSSGNDTTNADGRATVSVTYDDTRAAALNPFFTIAVPEAKRKVPAGAPAKKQLTLPDEWVTRHYVNRRVPDISKYANPDHALDLHVGVRATLRVSYSDFHASDTRNPLALPEDTVGIHLADYDEFVLDYLNLDETLTGVVYDSRAGELVTAGPGIRYPYLDVPPTAPIAFDGVPAAPRAWVDPPGAPVGQLGGGSYTQVGKLAVDPHGFVFMIDGNVVRRFYPDGTLCQTLTVAFNAPRALALDQYRNLYVAEANAPHDRIVVVAADEGAVYGRVAGLYAPTGAASLGTISDLAVLPSRALDQPEMLAVADSVGSRVRLLRIDIAAGGVAIRRAVLPTITLVSLPSFPVPGPTPQPVALAAGPGGRLLVAGAGSHRVSRWHVDPAGVPTHQADWERLNGGPGAGPGEFDTPVGLALDSQHGVLYVAETGNGRVQRLDVTGGALGNWTPTGPPFTPGAVAADGRGDVYVTDTTSARVFRASTFDAAGAKLAPAAAPLPVGSPWTRSTEGGHMRAPEYVALGSGDRLWVADTGNNRVLAFARDARGELVPAAVGVTAPGLSGPRGIAEDGDGNVYVADSGNHRVRQYNAAGVHVRDFGTGAAGAGANQFHGPGGVAVAQRTEPVIYVADTNNNRIQRLHRDGSFLAPLPISGVVLAGPMDVAVAEDGVVFVADTGNRRIVEFDAKDAFARVIGLPAIPGFAAGAATLVSGVAAEPDGNLIVTDRAKNLVMRIGRDGTLLAWWDLLALVAPGTAAPPYEPDLARQLRFSAPTRAVVDGRGLLCVADTGHDRVRLARTATTVDVTLLDLDDALPDISFRAVTEADWKATLGLTLKVGDINLFDESQSLEMAPEANFAGDAYERTRVLGREHGTNAAINLMRVVRTAQRWYKAHTATAAAGRRWGAAGASESVNADLQKYLGTFTLLDINFDPDDPTGRGNDAWDDAVVVHEFGHKVFYRAIRPSVPYSLYAAAWIPAGGSHSKSLLTNQAAAMSEGWAEYVEFFFGDEYDTTDRVRGFPRSLAGVNESGDPPEHLYGGVETAPPTFDAPERGVDSEGYVANMLYQLHRALVDPEVLFADSPGYWHGFNANVTKDRADRFDALIWKPLTMWPAVPTPADLLRPARIYFDNVLRQARALGSREGAVVQSLLELNNLAAPVLAVTLSTGGEPDDPIELKPADVRTLEIRLADRNGSPLADYNLVFSGAAIVFTPAGAGPAPRHGVRAVGPDSEHATDATGTVTITYTAPPLPVGKTELVQTLEVSYQPDFDTDVSFAPPLPGDDRETTLSQAYLYELRSANKSWAGVGSNRGVRVSTKVNFRVSV